MRFWLGSLLCAALLTIGNAAGCKEKIRVPAKKGQKARTAEVSVSWQQVKVLPPRQRRGDERGVPFRVWVVRVAETNPP